LGSSTRFGSPVVSLLSAVKRLIQEGGCHDV